MERTKDKFLQEFSTPFDFLFDAYYFNGYTVNTEDTKEDLDDNESK
jgi:hypothetical protein